MSFGSLDKKMDLALPVYWLINILSEFNEKRLIGLPVVVVMNFDVDCFLLVAGQKVKSAIGLRGFN